ncbi:hypothetical protein NPIL_467351 [Nephila pilipes]|uniref:Uncharacterized protein n=1 Tax=Nephila pilipes TaxID=299642 RepID=A0A8X6UGN4_NEPPI|nr:hypothetical protein NPIL_467351 [Nephila pilipes]
MSSSVLRKMKNQRLNSHFCFEYDDMTGTGLEKNAKSKNFRVLGLLEVVSWKGCVVIGLLVERRFISIHYLGGEVQQKSPPQQQLCYWKRTGCALAVKNRENCYPRDTLCSQRNLVSGISVDFHRHFRDLSNYYTICGHGFRERLLQSGRTHSTLCGSGSGGGQSHSRHVSHRRDPVLGRNRLGIPSFRNKRGQNEGSTELLVKNAEN